MRQRWAIVLVAIVAAAGLAVFIALAFKSRLVEAQKRADARMAMFQPPLVRSSTKFTLRLDHEIPPGHWPGLRPGWIVGYTNNSTNLTHSPVLFYLNCSGEFLHSQPPSWLRELNRPN